MWAPTVGGTKRRAGFALPWAAVSWAGRLGPRRRKEPGGPTGALGQKPGRERVSFFFFLFSKLLNPFSNRFEFLFNFWIKTIQHNKKKYAPA